MTLKKVLTPAIITFFMCALISCGGSGTGTTGTDNKAASGTESNGGMKARMAMMPMPQGGDKFIPVDSADTMLLSYLNSINYEQNDTSLHSLIIDADSLRAYLADTSIKHMKIMFAHTLNYIRNGGQNTNCGYNSGQLTFVLAGYNSMGNYVYYNPNGTGNMVLNHGIPCPNLCPPSGSASNNLLVK